MTFQDIKTKDYKLIKEKYGADYVYHYNLALAEHNNLVNTPLYKKLLLLPQLLEEFYVLALIDQAGNCIRAAWTSLPLIQFWINHLKRDNLDINCIKDIIVVDIYKDKKEAIRRCKDLKPSILKISRDYKISKLQTL